MLLPQLGGRLFQKLDAFSRRLFVLLFVVFVTIAVANNVVTFAIGITVAVAVVAVVGGGGVVVVVVVVS